MSHLVEKLAAVSPRDHGTKVLILDDITRPGMHRVDDQDTLDLIPAFELTDAPQRDPGAGEIPAVPIPQRLPSTGRRRNTVFDDRGPAENLGQPRARPLPRSWTPFPGSCRTVARRLIRGRAWLWRLGGGTGRPWSLPLERPSEGRRIG
ncbi:hypothetical protein [Streptomyces sp. NPDC050287]|uniref:hypothetical protein n=1 Tax=Streptomyces sp. NPDC050287 TaxID=3365608 RepID=UPI0037944CEC